MAIANMKQLLEAGVHFGHQSKKWNPKMKKYIFGKRNDIYIIDLQKTVGLIDKAYEFVRDLVKNGGTVLFVGTKKQASDAIKEEALRARMPYINTRWLGGTLTNFSTIKVSMQKMIDYENKFETGDFENYTKKEIAVITKKLDKLRKYHSGIKNLADSSRAVPVDALFVVDTVQEEIAVKEARKLGVPIVGIIDTNSDPDFIDYPITGNDDAIRAVKLITSFIADACIEGKKQAEELKSIEAEGEEAEEQKEEIESEGISGNSPEKLKKDEDYDPIQIKDIDIKYDDVYDDDNDDKDE